MMYRLMTKDCRWSLVSLKDKPTTMCCLNHHPEVKIREWESKEKYDPNAGEQQSFDVLVDNIGAIVKMKP